MVVINVSRPFEVPKADSSVSLGVRIARFFLRQIYILIAYYYHDLLICHASIRCLYVFPLHYYYPAATAFLAHDDANQQETEAELS